MTVAGQRFVSGTDSGFPVGDVQALEYKHTIAKGGSTTGCMDFEELPVPNNLKKLLEMEREKHWWYKKWAAGGWCILWICRHFVP